MREIILSVVSAFHSGLDFIWNMPTLLWIVVAAVLVFGLVNASWSKL
jgi:hypothetical protein